MELVVEGEEGGEEAEEEAQAASVHIEDLTAIGLRTRMSEPSRITMSQLSLANTTAENRSQTPPRTNRQELKTKRHTVLFLAPTGTRPMRSQPHDRTWHCCKASTSPKALRPSDAS